jgi:diacylglycerol kinase (ATP)
MTMVVVANGRYLGGGFQAAPQASISDGLFDITILKNSGSFKMLDELANNKGDADYADEKNDIFYVQAKKVSIKSKERDITVALDGEPVGILPATFEVYQNALGVNSMVYLRAVEPLTSSDIERICTPKMLATRIENLSRWNRPFISFLI